MTAHRTCSSRRICTYLKFAGNQLLHSFFSLDDHYQIDAFKTDLKTSASAADCKEGRCAPSVGVSASGHALAMATSQNKTTFKHVWHHCYALCVFQDFLRNAFIRRIHDLVQHLS